MMARTKAARQPLFWAAVSFSAGILAGTYLWRPPLWWLLAAVVCTLGAIRFRGPQGWRERTAWALALLATAAAGAWAVSIYRRPVLPDLSAFTDNRVVTVTGYVSRDGVAHGKGGRQRQNVDLVTESIERDGVVLPIKAGLRMSFFGPALVEEPAEEDAASAAPAEEREAIAGNEEPAEPRRRRMVAGTLAYGQRVRFPVKLRKLRNYQNPGAWDYVGYLRQQGISATGAAAAKKIEFLPGTAGSAAGRCLSRIRRSLLARVKALWPEKDEGDASSAGNEQAGLLAAILLGDRTYLETRTSAAWQRTGLYHILVIDGLKVGIFAYFVFWVLRRLYAGEGLATLGTILLSAGYAWLTELGTPARRSVLMLTVYLLTRLLYRERALLNAIGAAALALLVVNPEALFDASFQLSFLSVVAIAALSVPLVERTSQAYHRGVRWLSSAEYDLFLEPRVAQFRIDLRLLAGRLAKLAPGDPKRVGRGVLRIFQLVLAAAFSLYEVAVISAVLQLALILPMTVYFHRATIVGVPANAVAVPLTSVLVVTAAIAVGLSYVWLPLALVPARIAGWVLTAITATARIFDGVRLADVRLPMPTPTAAAAGVAALVAAMLLARRRARLAAVGFLLLAGVSVWLSLPIAHPQVRPGVLEVTGIDVGQAESTLVVTPAGETVLVDAAGPLGPFASNFDFGENVVAPYLWERGFTRLDALALTHAHSDHMGGMPSLIASFHPRQLWLGPNAQTPELERLREQARKYHVQIIERQGTERFTFGGAQFEVLAPPPGWQPKAKPQNNDSMVLRVSYGATSALLTGDAEKKSERYMAEGNPQATLLKLAHNGSRTSTTPEFLAKVKPQFAYISVGAQNSFGHPRMEVLEQVGAAHVLTYRTDTQGAITFWLDGAGVTARPAVIR
jgi:competence protein ComEC